MDSKYSWYITQGSVTLRLYLYFLLLKFQLTYQRDHCNKLYEGLMSENSVDGVKRFKPSPNTGHRDDSLYMIRS